MCQILSQQCLFISLYHGDRGTPSFALFSLLTCTVQLQSPEMQLIELLIEMGGSKAIFNAHPMLSINLRKCLIKIQMNDGEGTHLLAMTYMYIINVQQNILVNNNGRVLYDWHTLQQYKTSKITLKKIALYPMQRQLPNLNVLKEVQVELLLCKYRMIDNKSEPF